jgi:hypothetical protein
MSAPNESNGYLQTHVSRMLTSYRHWTGKDLLTPDLPPLEQARDIFNAPFAVLSHDTAADPILNYGNRFGLQVFELTWEELIVMPSRRTAEPMHRDERARLLDRVSRQGYIDDYSGVRISKTGRRFMIEQATVWNLLDENGATYGQAATFSQWRYLD